MAGNNIFVGGPNLTEYVQCPYDSAHRILPVRLAFHLNRCAKNFPCSKMVRCPFNTSHLYSVTNMQEHIIECPNRSNLERYKMPDMLPLVEPPRHEFIVDSAENWDDDPPVPTYNPKTYCEEKFIIRNPQGAPPAARREFRERERRRFTANNQF
ncbi:gametocyte-specific factor 1 homolog [Drosophila eugracilis]|uniref:gametocyte-specific factor 1 homolog n=1 Tax=Drosophila eugracilis TaxID=29029 RepID=UPI0007E83EC7|nr:gametocyte-specific factor 1 homolog [Drosophila eugracilis]